MSYMKKKISKQYISETEKKEFDNELLPNGIFYYNVNHSAFDSILKRLESQFETINDYADTLNTAIHRNGLIFRNSLNGLNRAEVMDSIKVQYSYYKERCNNMSQWLRVTKDLIIKGFSIEKELSKEIQYDFNLWYDNELKIIITDYLKKDLENEFNSWKIELNNPLANELQFLIDKKNECEKAITRAKELNIKFFHGKPSTLLYKETNELTKLDIINERINELSKPQQSNEVIKSNKPINEQPVLKELALFHVYLKTKITKDNAKDYLKNTTHSSGKKFKQDFDFFSLSKNRIYGGTDRSNSYKDKYLKKVIEMLKATNNINAIKDAENDLNTFEKNIQ